MFKGLENAHQFAIEARTSTDLSQVTEMRPLNAFFDPTAALRRALQFASGVSIRELAQTIANAGGCKEALPCDTFKSDDTLRELVDKRCTVRHAL